MDCSTCNKNTELNSNGICKKCNKIDGLRQCNKCGFILPILLSFYDRHGVCKGCISKAHKKENPRTRRKLTDEQEESVCVQYAEGASSIELSKKYGISPVTIIRTLNKHKIEKRADSQRAHKLNETFFETIDSPEKAYWLGFIATDGNIYGTRIQINLKDKEHLELFAKDIGSSSPVKEYKSHGHTMFKIGFRSKKMVQDLKNLGIEPRKTFTVKPWNGPEELMPHYWRGCVDGDGWIFKTVSGFEIGFCGNSQMVNGFAQYLTERGVEPSVRKCRNIFEGHVRAMPKLIKTIELLHYDSNNKTLKRKMDVVNAILQKSQSLSANGNLPPPASSPPPSFQPLLEIVPNQPS